MKRATNNAPFLFGYSLFECFFSYEIDPFFICQMVTFGNFSRSETVSYLPLIFLNSCLDYYMKTF